MTTSDSNQPQLDRKSILVGLFVHSSIYALLLCTKTGRRWADEQTWAVTTGSVLMVSGFLALEDHRAAKLNIIYFIVAGIPIVFRSLWIQLERMDKAYARFTKTGG